MAESIFSLTSSSLLLDNLSNNPANFFICDFFNFVTSFCNKNYVTFCFFVHFCNNKTFFLTKNTKKSKKRQKNTKKCKKLQKKAKKRQKKTKKLQKIDHFRLIFPIISFP